MAKIIIEFDEAKVSPAYAAYLAYRVLFRGKVKGPDSAPHYPPLTRIRRWPGWMEVVTRKKKKGRETDSFVIQESTDTRPMLVKD